MIAIDGTERIFLFLQGPHGPFFRQLARMLGCAGATCWRVGFNRGDQVFWGDRASYIPFTAPQETWAETFEALLDNKSVTDIVLYGDTRHVHAEAVRIAKARGLTVHVFEEGYLRPYWVSYERGGSNGHSRLMEMSIADMQAALAGTTRESPVAPAHWGDMRHHIFYGALYHWFVMFANRPYRGFRPHRDISVTKEFKLYLRRLLLMPAHALERRLATRAVIHGGFPYHLVLLQLAHDSSFTAHSPFSRVTEFLEAVIAGFAAGAPRHHHLVFKAHPLEDGREPLAREIKRLAHKYDVESRVHHLRGGKLARLLDHARSAVTVNSTAAQQVLWRGLPIKTFGRAVYAKPEFVSTQPVAAFFAHPTRPDTAAYRDYRAYLLETSQVAGGFYAARARRQLLRQVVDMMLSPDDAYDALARGTAAPRQRLRAVT